MSSVDGAFDIRNACLFCAEPIGEDEIGADIQVEVTTGSIGWYVCHASCFERAAHDPIDISALPERSHDEPPPDPAKVEAVDRLHAFWQRMWERLDQRLEQEDVTPAQLDGLAEALEREARRRDALTD